MRNTVALMALLSHWRRHKVQLAMLLLGLSLATALWTGVQAINVEARASYAQAASALGGDKLSQIVAADGGTIAQSAYIALRRAGWQVSPVVEGEYRVGSVRVRLMGVDPMTMPPEAMTVPAIVTNLAGFMAPAGILYAAPETAARLGGGLVGADGLPIGLVMSDIGVAQRLLGMQGQISRLILSKIQPIGVPKLADVVPGLRVRPPDASGDLSRLTDSFHLNLTAFGLLAFLVGLFIVQSAIGLAFEQRRALVRTLRALGMPLSGVMVVLVVELVGLALVAGLVGVGMGYGIARVLLPSVAATLRGLYGAEVTGNLHMRLDWAAAGIAIAVAGTMAAAALHLTQIWRMPLLSVAQVGGGAAGARRLLRVQTAAGAGFAVLAGGLLLFGHGLAAGFGVLAALFLGAACFLPVAVAGLLGLARRGARSPVAEWFWADTRAQLPGLSLALVALMLALATNLGVGTMVSSFRLTFDGWLDQRLASELYVTTRDPAESRAVSAWLASRSDAVLPIWSAHIEIYGQPGELYGVADHATYRDNWPLLQATPDVWDAVAAGTGVLINEQLHYRQKIGLGDTLTLPGNWSPPVVGIYSDYGNPLVQVIANNATLAEHFPEISKLRMGVRVDPARAVALADAVREAFDLPVNNVVDQSAIKTLSRRVFERTFRVTAALNILTLGVAGVAMFASLMTLSGMRLPQMAPVWAMGLTRGALAQLEFVRSVMLAAMTFVVALPVGLGLAWVLLNVVNVEAFGWRLPMYLFPADWLTLAGFGLAAAALAAAVPVRHLARIHPNDLLQAFTNER